MRTDTADAFVLLDRDGTIIEERHYLSAPDGVDLINGAATGLRQLCRKGLGLVVVTNQSGIGRGYFSAEQADSVNERMCALLTSEEVELSGIYICPHMPEENCRCRKPAPGLAEQAAWELNFNLAQCVVVGDKACDIELGQQVGAKTVLVRTGYGRQVEAEKGAYPDAVIDGLWDFEPLLALLR